MMNEPSGYQEPRLVYAREGQIPELEARIERLTAENERLRGLISRNFDAMEVAFGDSPDAAAIREIVNQQSGSK